MKDERFLFAQFCDDVRQEVGNKLTLVGCYSADLLVPTFPTVLPKLCVFAKAFTPVSRPFGQLTFKVFVGDRVLAEFTAAETDLAAAATSAEMLADARWHVVTSVLAFSPFPVEAPCIVRVVAELEDELLTSPQLRVHQIPGSFSA
jgi:hypothetical protein